MTDEKKALPDEALDNVNGGFIVDRGTFNLRYVVDGSGTRIGDSYYLKTAREVAAENGVSDMVITMAELSQLRENGYFIRDGVKYSEENGTVITE